MLFVYLALSVAVVLLLENPALSLCKGNYPLHPDLLCILSSYTENSSVMSAGYPTICDSEATYLEI